jgi:predicted O-methyltransferase YrrM
LGRLASDSFDIIYIDGSHVASDVFEDAVRSWPLLKNDGLLIFDDYLWKKELPVESRPQVAIDAFIAAYRDYMEVVNRRYQVMIRKRNAMLPNNRDTSYFI